MPMTAGVSEEALPRNGLTLVNELELRNNIKANVRELVFQHAQEHGQEVVYRPNKSEAATEMKALLLLLAQNRR